MPFDSTFNSIFPRFVERCVELQSLLTPVAYVLLVVGMISSTIAEHGNPSAHLRVFGRTIVYVALLVFMVSWGNQIATVVDHTVKEVFKADPSKVYEDYNALLAPKKSDTESSWFDKLWSLDTAIIEALISGLLFLFGWFAGNLVFWVYLIQKMILFFGYALAPIFVGFLAVPSLSGVGRKYFLNLVGVLLWPLGWGLASIVTQGLLDFMTDQSFLTVPVAGGVGYGLQNLLGVAILGVWLIFSTVAAPVILQKAITEGFLTGASLFSGAFSAGRSAVGAGAGAAASVALRGGSAGLAAAAGVGTAAESLMSGGGSLIGSMASMQTQTGRGKGGQHPRPVRFPQNDPLGDRTTQDTLRNAQKSV